MAQIRSPHRFRNWGCRNFVFSFSLFRQLVLFCSCRRVCWRLRFRPENELFHWRTLHPRPTDFCAVVDSQRLELHHFLHRLRILLPFGFLHRRRRVRVLHGYSPSSVLHILHAYHPTWPINFYFLEIYRMPCHLHAITVPLKLEERCKKGIKCLHRIS